MFAGVGWHEASVLKNNPLRSSIYSKTREQMANICEFAKFRQTRTSGVNTSMHIYSISTTSVTSLKLLRNDKLALFLSLKG